MAEVSAERERMLTDGLSITGELLKRSDSKSMTEVVDAWSAAASLMQTDGAEELSEDCMNSGIGQSITLQRNENLGSERIDALSRGKIPVYGMLCSFMERHKSALSELRRANEKSVCGDVSDL